MDDDRTGALIMETEANEAAALRQVANRAKRLRSFAIDRPSPEPGASPPEWFAWLAEMKAIQGNVSNDLSLVSCLMTKAWLGERFSLVPFDVAAKPQGANGLDIDVRTTTGQRIVGEIKTTSPSLGTRFGAAQLMSLRKDFAKLRNADADHRFMFVTDPAAFEVLARSFASELPDVMIVCLTTGDEQPCPSRGDAKAEAR